MGRLRHGYEIEPDPPGPGEPATVRLHADGIDAATLRLSDGRIEFREDAPGRWSALVPGHPDGTRVGYRIEVVRDGVRAFVDDAGPAYERPAPGISWIRPPCEQYSYVVQRPSVPDWVHDAVVYHALVDRFAGPVAADPPWLGFAGGTLSALTDRLGYVAALGANCLLISPIFPASTHVCYDHTDLFAVEPRFGSLDDARVLCAQAHAMGMRVLLDIELCYVGAGHPFVRDPERRAWFHRTPDGRTYGWRGSDMLVAIDQSAPGARAHLIDAVRFWLDLGFDGFRVDSAHAGSLDFWAELGQAVGSHRPDAFLFGEAVERWEQCLHYRGRLHGFLDFELCSALRGFVGDGSVTASQFDDVVRMRDSLPSGLVTPAFFENHDMDRLAFVAAGDLRRLLLAYLLLLTLPGPPVMYYGSEAGMSQTEAGDCDIVARRPMPWGVSQDAGLGEKVGRLVNARRRMPALSRGTRRTVLVRDPGIYAFSRSLGAETVHVVVNASDDTVSVDELGVSLGAWEGRSIAGDL